MYKKSRISGGAILKTNYLFVSIGGYHILFLHSSLISYFLPPFLIHDYLRSSILRRFSSESKCRPHIPRQDNIIYRIHDIPQLICIRRIRIMHIYLLMLTPVQPNKPFPEKLCRLLHTRVWSLIIREIISYARVVEFFPEDVGLVEEEDDGCVGEPLGVADLVE